MSFDAIPILDISRARDDLQKADFLKDLRKALLEVGFFYISNTGISNALLEKVIRHGKDFFQLPTEAKLNIQMKKQPSFLGQ